MTALLSTTYFGPVQWYQKLYRHDHVLIEACESFVKQTYRNRCCIATAQGVQTLTVPVVHADGGGQSALVGNLLLSDHGNWRHQHWQAITSAYGDSPFLEYYEDDLRPFFFEHRWERLLDFNEAIRSKMCELLDITPDVSLTHYYIKGDDDCIKRDESCIKSDDSYTKDDDGAAHQQSQLSDFRYAIRPKQPLPDAAFQPRPYYQVFSSRHGFLPNLSILDLLLNMGPEAVFYL